MKKVGKVFLGLGIALTVLIVAPVAALYACFYDNSENPITYNDDFNADDFFVNTFSDSIDNTKNDHKININVTEQTLNDYLHATIAKADGFPSEYVGQVYLTIEDGEYVFNVGAHYEKWFSTKLKLITELEYGNDADGDQAFIFKIKNCKLGRIGKLDDAAISVVKNFFSDEDINGSLSDSGVHMTLSFDNKQLTYKEKDLVADIDRYVGTEDSSNAKLLIGVLQDFLANDYVSFNFKDSINVYANLEPFGEITESTPANLFDTSKEGSVDFGKFADALPKLAADGIIDTDHYNAVFKYLTYGYDNVDEDTQNYVADKVFENLGIYENGYSNETYPGVVNNDNDRLMDIIQDQTTALEDLEQGSVISFMTENQANAYIGGSGFVGYSYLLTNADKTDVNYIVIDNFYCNLFQNADGEGCFPIVAGLNFNGYETRVAFDMVMDPELCQGYRMGFKVKDIYFGEYNTSDTLSDFLFQLMVDNLSDDSTLQIDNENMTISVDFTDALQDSTKAAVEAIGTPVMQIFGDGMADDGRIVAVIE